ncbi:hypothetical protein AVEN_145263-1 [Araneus ventricosus]|uniref:Uncharacterized protein n=1 Tax=Araneus ventricosus TaxID=182803 RepID=A0A4Y2PQW8_ARAVE|nr:hypothetical protein AVEN_145263-1 [Araneus ventricosus]
MSIRSVRMLPLNGCQPQNRFGNYYRNSNGTGTSHHLMKQAAAKLNLNAATSLSGMPPPQLVGEMAFVRSSSPPSKNVSKQFLAYFASYFRNGDEY